MARVFSGIQPSGELHLGNLLGALVNWVKHQESNDAVYCIVDLHALTLPQDPEELRKNTLELAQLLIAVGLDPQDCILFIQSHVPEHSQLAWLMECTVSFGELNRMTAFKDKSGRNEFISGGLFTYPALQAADILLYDTDLVPVGDDQRQHLEITRDIAERFNSRFGETFIVPEHVIPPAGARIMDLQHPDKKMSKSEISPGGTIGVLESPDAIVKKIKRAVTDSDSEVRFDLAEKPGISNLLSILGAATSSDPKSLSESYERYGDLKNDTAEAVIHLLEPIQRRFFELQADPGETQRLLQLGASRAQEISSRTLERAKTNAGLLQP
ncbi:MAG: tryptophan--tRNA ligase [Acidimicrobiales bacterium]|nr:tryptophan--tRNA ligase [Acidimicrobiales bacterium]MDP6299287.1 tryptophan--tRNA ligase [Acidimicrobiales bacterium]HJM28750.1 tryptophan--tRNA ligase [Acidimicrobiales bacterium]HJM96655.1 tryptophan--tRNA ligase [Acidimicrobiales bacterium]